MLKVPKHHLVFRLNYRGTPGLKYLLHGASVLLIGAIPIDEPVPSFGQEFPLNRFFSVRTRVALSNPSLHSP